MRFKSNLFKVAFLPLLFVLVSCVKDIDISQHEEVLFTPEAAIDLIYFTIDSQDFSTDSNGNVRAADATRLEFLDDDYIQSGLMRADFEYRFTNTFQKDLTAHIKFLAPNNGVQHDLVIPIPAGSASSPEVVGYEDIIYEDQIQKIRRSIKMSVEITMQDGSTVEGEFQMESKAFYYFEF